MSKQPYNLAEWEWDVEILADLRKRLLAGAEGPGVTLSAKECERLVFSIAYPKRPKGTPVRNIAARATIAGTCRGYEALGKPLKEAVQLTAKEFEVSPSTVYSARKEWKTEPFR
jgi:hypothetical protein